MAPSYMAVRVRLVLVRHGVLWFGSLGRFWWAWVWQGKFSYGMAVLVGRVRLGPVVVSSGSYGLSC